MSHKYKMHILEGMCFVSFATVYVVTNEDHCLELLPAASLRKHLAFPHSFAKGFDGWTAYTPFLLLSDIETSFGLSVKEAIEAQLGNAQIDYIRTYTLDEYYMYGSARLGAKKQNEVIYREEFTGNVGPAYWSPSVGQQNDLEEALIETENYDHNAGKKRFELSNHLGNVMAVISDRKLAVDDNTDNQIDYFEADIASAQDYYPFGSIMPGRSYVNTTFSNGGYRYGFNTQEKDDEIYGDGNSTTAMY